MTHQLMLSAKKNWRKLDLRTACPNSSGGLSSATGSSRNQGGRIRPSPTFGHSSPPDPRRTADWQSQCGGWLRHPYLPRGHRRQEGHCRPSDPPQWQAMAREHARCHRPQPHSSRHRAPWSQPKAQLERRSPTKSGRDLSRARKRSGRWFSRRLIALHQGARRARHDRSPGGSNWWCLPAHLRPQSRQAPIPGFRGFSRTVGVLPRTPEPLHRAWNNLKRISFNW